MIFHIASLSVFIFLDFYVVTKMWRTKQKLGDLFPQLGPFLKVRFNPQNYLERTNQKCPYESTCFNFKIFWQNLLNANYLLRGKIIGYFSSFWKFVIANFRLAAIKTTIKIHVFWLIVISCLVKNRKRNLTTIHIPFQVITGLPN